MQDWGRKVQHAPAPSGLRCGCFGVASGGAGAVLSDETTTRPASLSTTPDQLTPADRERTLRLSVREGLVWSIMWGFGEAYIAPFAVFLKAGPTAMALLGTLPGLLGAAGQWLGATMMERTRRRRPLLVATHVIQGLAFIPLYLIPLLFPSAGAAAVVAVYSVATLLFSGGGPMWISLMGDVVPEDRRGRFFGHRNRAVMAGMVVSMLLAAVVMSRFTACGLPWLGFGLLFGLSAAARLVCSRLMRRHADPPLAVPDVIGARGLSWWGRLRGSPFAYFALVHTLLNGAVTLAGPFFPLYMLRDLHWDYLRFTAMTVAFLLAQISVIRWWGALCDRHGNRVVYLATSLLAPLPMLAWCVSSDFRVLLGAQMVSGALGAGLNLAASNYMYDSVASAYRARVISYQSLLVAVVNVGAGLLGAALARRLPHDFSLATLHVVMPSNLPALFLLAALARLLLGLLLLPRLREVRPIEPVSSLEIMRRFALGQPLWEPMGQLALRVSQRRIFPRRGSGA